MNPPRTDIAAAPPAPGRGALPPAWRVALPPFVLLMAALVWLYRDTLLGMVAIWSRSETFAHAYFVPPLVAWLIWRRRQALVPLVPRPHLPSLVALAAAAFFWLLGGLAWSNAATQFAATALLVLAVPALLGPAVARTLAFPLGFLFFAVPVGEFLLPVLMERTADFTVLALRLSGIPVYREGLQFVIPSGNWSVVEACSGVRYLIASLMVGVLFAYLNFRSTRRRLLFVAVAIVVPVIANWVRAYLIVLIGHMSGNTLAVGVDHLIYGWIFFGIVVTLMFSIGSRWAERSPDDEAPDATRPGPAAAAPAWAMAGAALLVLLAPTLGWRALAGGPAPSETSVVRLDLPPRLAGDWQVRASVAGAWKPAYTGADAELQRSYAAAGGSEVQLYIAYYRGQDERRKLVSSENVLVTYHDEHWAPVTESRRVLPTPGGDVTWRNVDLRGSPHPGQAAQARLVAWQTYWVDGRWTASELHATALGVYHRLLGRGKAGAIVVVSADATADRAQAEAAVESFLRANLDTLSSELGRARDGDHLASAEK